MADKKKTDPASEHDTVLPLPTDHPDSSGDSTQGNAPYGPADIVHGVDSDGNSDTGSGENADTDAAVPDDGDQSV